MARPPERARPLPEGWTFRRVPNRIARGLLAASLVAVGLFALHVGGFGLLERMSLRLVGSAYLVGLPVALVFAFFVAAPLLRLRLRRGGLTRGAVVGLGAVCYGGIVLLWMAALRAGPPDELMAALFGAPETLGQRPAAWESAGAEAFRWAYRLVLTPAAFALYGAIAGAAGWLAAFGPARRRAEGVLTA